MSEMLSQEEIDALLKGDSNTSTSSQEETDTVFSALSEEEIDALGEIGNISMGTSATTLFTLLNNRVNITTPIVTVLSLRELARQYPTPYVAVEVKYTEGLIGANLLILKEDDVKIITDLMMGGDGSNTQGEINELHLSAIGEAMNQMIGSSSTSLSTMFNKKIDISPPQAFVTEFGDINLAEFKPDDLIAKISFRMVIGDIIDSEIMQIIPVEFGKALVNNLLSGTEPQQVQEVKKSNSTTSVENKPVENKNTQKTVPKNTIMENKREAYDDSPPKLSHREQPKIVNVQPVQYESFDEQQWSTDKESIDLIVDVPLEITVELGRTKKLIKDILEFGPGTVLELDRLAGEPVDILVNGKFIAKGEVVVIDESFGVRITDIISGSKRLSRIQ